MLGVLSGLPTRPFRSFGLAIAGMRPTAGGAVDERRVRRLEALPARSALPDPTRAVDDSPRVGVPVDLDDVGAIEPLDERTAGRDRGLYLSREVEPFRLGGLPGPRLRGSPRRPGRRAPSSVLSKDGVDVPLVVERDLGVRRERLERRPGMTRRAVRQDPLEPIVAIRGLPENLIDLCFERVLKLLEPGEPEASGVRQVDRDSQVGLDVNVVRAIPGDRSAPWKLDHDHGSVRRPASATRSRSRCFSVASSYSASITSSRWGVTVTSSFGPNASPRRRSNQKAAALQDPRARKEPRKSYEAIANDIAAVPKFADRPPSAATVKKYGAPARRRRPGEPWRLQPRDPGAGDERALLDVLGAVMDATDGAISYLTDAEAAWFVVICSAAPKLPGWDAFVIAQTAIESDDPTDVQVFLACRPWTPDGWERYQRAKDRGVIRRLLFTYREGLRYESPDEILTRERAEVPQRRAEGERE